MIKYSWGSECKARLLSHQASVGVAEGYQKLKPLFLLREGTIHCMIYIGRATLVMKYQRECHECASGIAAVWPGFKHNIP